MKRSINIFITAIMTFGFWGLLVGQEQNHDHFGRVGLNYLNTMSKKVTETQAD
jgi:hypothetical protein